MIIITGEIGIGKSTICSQIEQLARLSQLTCGGIITSKSINGGIDIRDLQTGRTAPFASVETNPQSLIIGKYSFYDNGINFGIKAIQRGISSDILFLDELGHLELAGRGFFCTIKLLDSDKVKTSIVVIRKKLLPEYLKILKNISMVFEATSHTRNELPEIVFSKIIYQVKDSRSLKLKNE